MHVLHIVQVIDGEVEGEWHQGRAGSCSPVARTEQKPEELWECSQGSDLLWEWRLDPCVPCSREILLTWRVSFQERKLVGPLA